MGAKLSVYTRTLARHCLDLEPSSFVLRAIEIKEKSGFSSFFFFLIFLPCRDDDQIQPRDVRQDEGQEERTPLEFREEGGAGVEKGTLITPITFIPEATRAASPATSVEEITPRPKRQRTMDKGKEKEGSWSSSIWDDAGLALTRAQDAFTAEDLKVFLGIHSNEIVSRHIHKLVQVMYTYHTFFLLCCGLAYEV